jgi:hypothetical protein
MHRFFRFSDLCVYQLLFGGGVITKNKFLLDSIFPTKLTEFPTKLTEFVPFIFISQYCPTVKRILPDWLCLPNKLGGGGGGGGGGCRPLRPPARYAHAFVSHQFYFFERPAEEGKAFYFFERLFQTILAKS